MPDSHKMETGGVVLIAPEDGEGDTLRPRLEAAKADLDKVIFLGTPSEEQGLSIPENIDILREAIEEIDAKLVVIDPIMGVLSGKADSHRDQDVRRAMGEVVKLAEEKRCSVVGIMHLNKGQSSNALYRSGGSVGFIALARSAMRVVINPEEPESRVLVHYKHNLSPQASSVKYG